MCCSLARSALSFDCLFFVAGESSSPIDNTSRLWTPVHYFPHAQQVSFTTIIAFLRLKTPRYHKPPVPFPSLQVQASIPDSYTDASYHSYLTHQTTIADPSPTPSKTTNYATQTIHRHRHPFLKRNWWVWLIRVRKILTADLPLSTMNLIWEGGKIHLR